MSTVFLKLELAAHNDPPTVVLINAAQIISVHPTWPGGSLIITTDSNTENEGIHVRLSVDELHTLLRATNGNVIVKSAP